MKVLGRLRQGVVVTAMILLGACTGNNAQCVQIPTIQNGPAMLVPTLISPAPGATGVSTGPLDVTIGNAVGVSSLFLKDAGGNVTFATNFRQANPPSDDVRAGTFTQLASQTTYTVFVSGPSFPFDPCGPHPASQPVPSPIGSFTTR
jgi:hypothetical protein